MKLGKTEEKTIPSYGKLKESLIGDKKVTFWETTWKETYGFIVEGADIELTIVEKEKNGRMNYTAYPPQQATGGQKQAFGGGMGAKMMDKKNENIKQAQENKDWSIFTSSTFRDSTLMTVAQFVGKTPSPEELRITWLDWRKWLCDHYDLDEKDFKQPF